jgi:hypothetical protein
MALVILYYSPLPPLCLSYLPVLLPDLAASVVLETVAHHLELINQ